MIRTRTGFTLLELMLVLLVIGLTASLIISTLPEKNGSVDSESEHLLKILQWIQQRSTEENRIYGVRIESHGWQILQLRPNQEKAPDWDGQLISDSVWQLLYQRGKVVARQLPERLQLQVTLEQSQLQLGVGENQQDDLLPTLLFLPGGELTAFQITLADMLQNKSIIIAASAQGEIERRAVAE